MLSKKIGFNFLNLFKKSKSSLLEKHDPLFENRDTESKRLTTIEEVDFQTKVSGFAVGFFTFLGLGALVLSIGLVIL